MTMVLVKVDVAGDGVAGRLRAADTRLHKGDMLTQPITRRRRRLA